VVNGVKDGWQRQARILRHTTHHLPLTNLSDVNMKERKPFLLRIDPALHEALEAWAQQELRSLNGQIEYLLKDAVAKRRKILDGDEGKEKKKESEK